MSDKFRKLDVEGGGFRKVPDAGAAEEGKEPEKPAKINENQVSSLRPLIYDTYIPLG